MLDRLSIKVIRWPLAQSARILNQAGVTANQTTLFGFALGCLASLLSLMSSTHSPLFLSFLIVFAMD